MGTNDLGLGQSDQFYLSPNSAPKLVPSPSEYDNTGRIHSSHGLTPAARVSPTRRLSTPRLRTLLPSLPCPQTGACA
ncbi:hypothetical protein GS491_25970 [Rhodococcus hoagii]|nr:hypothetical protein [Prescottella equi]NKR80567.1 hypothetical protein [Prescottella equi]NKR80574.1 hypothetical protein [Prescottella equi]NKS99493.1 hypothetical protein [Prescottella equi]